MEHLEERQLLAADFPGWQNLLVPTDVNNDGVVAPVDVLLVVHELRQTGSRFLEAPATAGAPSDLPPIEPTAEGEDASRAYIDVNGDGCLSPVDALLVVNELRAEGQTDLVQFRLEVTDTLGTPVSVVDQGDSFLLNVYVQDIRDGAVPNLGVFSAYLDITFDNALVTAVGPISFGDAYQELTAGSLATPGLVDEAGALQTGYGTGTSNPYAGPLGPGEFPLVSIPFEATNLGMVTFTSDPADLPVYHDVTLFEPATVVPTDDIIFGTTSLTIQVGEVVAVPDQFTVDEDSVNNVLDVMANDLINTAGSLTVIGVTPGDQGGTVINNGIHVLYTPVADFFGTERFTYTIGDGLGNTDEGTVTVTVENTNNDPPVANDDGGVGYGTIEHSAFTTANVLVNDTDPDGDQLTVFSFDTTGILGQVTSNGNGTFNYNPNGQFNYLSFGQQATDSFTYQVSDGHGLFDTATVTITIEGAPPAAGDITGSVFADVNNDGVRDDVERAIAGVEVRLEGTSIYGLPVALSTRTNARGEYQFLAVDPGDYQLSEIQPMFYVDGIDTVNGVPHAGPNDRVTITSAMDLPGFEVNFGERSLHPDFLSVGDIVNTELREGIVVGFDTQWNPLWYSLLDGWEDVSDLDATRSDDGETTELSLYLLDSVAVDLVFAVPNAPAQGRFRLMGETNQGRVVEFIGTMTQFQEPGSGLVAEGEGVPNDELVDSVFAALGQ